MNLFTKIIFVLIINTGSWSCRESKDPSDLEATFSTVFDPAKALLARTIGKMRNGANASPPVTEVWTDPQTGNKLKMIWRRYRHFYHFHTFKEDRDEIDLSLSTKIAFVIFREMSQGSWEQLKPLTVLDGVEDIKLNWNDRLKGYVGMSSELELFDYGKDSVEPYTRRAPLLITDVTFEDGNVRWILRDLFPRAVGLTQPGGIKFFEETWVLKDKRWETSWKFKTMDYDRDTLEPTVDLTPYSQEYRDDDKYLDSIKEEDAGLGSP